MAELTSPCTGVCRLHTITGWCVGCGRTLSEIGSWSGAGQDERARIWQDLPRRRAALAADAGDIGDVAGEEGAVGVRRPQR